MNRIEQLQREIEILKQAIKDTENQFLEKAYRESIGEKEKEINQLIDDDIEKEREYQEWLQQEMDTIKDLEDAQR